MMTMNMNNMGSIAANTLTSEVSYRRVAKAVADIEIGMVLAYVDVPSSPEYVFDALVNSKKIETWWGSELLYRVKDWKADFTVGGIYTVAVIRPDGAVYPASGKFLEIEFPAKLSHTRKYDWEHPNLGRHDTLITYNLNLITDGTRVTVRHEGFLGFPDAANEHADGWERVLNWLLEYLTSKQIHFKP